MKVILFTLLILLSNKIQSQIWVKDNATWIFSHYYQLFGSPEGNEEHYGYVKVSHIDDTIIQNKLCKKFQTKRYKFSGNPLNLGELVSVKVLDYNYTYVNEDTVFFLKDNQFRVLYNFDLQIGDSLAINFSPPITGSCKDTSYTKIIDAGILNFQGQDYRFIENFLSPDENWYELNGKFTDRFGPMDYFLFPNYKGYCPSVSGTEIYTYYNLVCFQDDELSIDFDGNNQCPNLFFLNLTDKNKLESFTLFPNPINEGSFKILNENNLEIKKLELIDFHGKICKSFKYQTDNNYQVNEIETGAYFLKINSNSDTYYLKILIE